EERDVPEREQEVLEDRQEPVRVLGGLLRLRLARTHLRRRRQQRLHLRDERVRPDVRLPRHLDRVELAPLVEDRLRSRQVEDRERRAAERAEAAEADRADDAKLLLRAKGEDADPVAEREVLRRGG